MAAAYTCPVVMFAARAVVMQVMVVVFMAITVQLLLPNDTATALTSGEKPEVTTKSCPFRMSCQAGLQGSAEAAVDVCGRQH